MSTKTEQPHKNTYAQKPTAFSILDALKYLLKECYRLNDVKKIMVLQKALIDLEHENNKSDYNQKEFDDVVTLLRKILTMSKHDLQDFILLVSASSDQQH